MILVVISSILISKYCLIQLHRTKMQYDFAQTMYYDYEYLDDVLNDHHKTYRKYETLLVLSVLVVLITMII